MTSFRDSNLTSEFTGGILSDQTTHPEYSKKKYPAIALVPKKDQTA